MVTAETNRYTRAVFDCTRPDNLHYRADDAFCIHPIFVRSTGSPMVATPAA